MYKCIVNVTPFFITHYATDIYIFVFNLRTHNIMRKINPKSNNNNSFKYSILISLHYYNIPDHREKTTKLDAYVNKYNFTNTNPTDFEKNNPNISLNILNKLNKHTYLINSSNNDCFKRAFMVKINDYRYVAIKCSSDNFIKTKQLITKNSHTELKQILIHIVKCFEYNQLRKILMDMIKNNMV